MTVPCTVFVLMVAFCLCLGRCKALYGDFCIADANCTLAVEKCDVQRKTCDCKIGYYYNHDNSPCKAKLALNSRCPRYLTESSPCADVNAECTDYKSFCKCKAGYFDSNGIYEAGGICTNMDMLKVTNIINLNITNPTQSITIKWNAPATYGSLNVWYEVRWDPPHYGGFLDVGDSTQAELLLKTMTKYTIRVNTFEYGSRSRYQYVTSSDKLIVIPKIALGFACNSTSFGESPCSDVNAECTTSEMGFCRCKEGYFDSNGFQKELGVCINLDKLRVKNLTIATINHQLIGITWNAPEIYSSLVSWYEMIWTPPDYSGSLSVGTTKAYIRLKPMTKYIVRVKTFEIRSRTSEQSVTSSEKLVFTTKFALGSACNSSMSEESVCSDENAECTSSGGNFCRCKEGYFDSNGFQKVNGKCIHMNRLKVTNIRLVFMNHEAVKMKWNAPTMYSSLVSSYEVIWSSGDDNGSSLNVGKSTEAFLWLKPLTQYIIHVNTIEFGSRIAKQSITSSDKLALTTRSYYGFRCHRTEDCDYPNSSCHSNKCKCETGFSKRGPFCVKTLSRDLGEECTFGCGVPGSVCYNNICVCKKSMLEYKGKCFSSTQLKLMAFMKRNGYGSR